jgi:hypothetical protein
MQFMLSVVIDVFYRSMYNSEVTRPGSSGYEWCTTTHELYKYDIDRNNKTEQAFDSQYV